MDGLETRAFELTNAEIRAEGSGDRQRFRFRGYAATFGEVSRGEIRELGVNGGRPFRERVGERAFEDTLRRDEHRFVLNHDLERLLGTTRAGTLRLGTDSRGLEVDADLPNTSYARDYAELVERGDAGEMSFRFFEPRDSWAETGEARLRTLEAVRLREVSALTVPAAYPETEATVALRYARALAEAEEELRAGRVLSEENLAALKDAHATIAAILDRAGASETAARSANPRRLRLELRERELELGIR